TNPKLLRRVERFQPLGPSHFRRAPFLSLGSFPGSRTTSQLSPRLDSRRIPCQARLGAQNVNSYHVIRGTAHYTVSIPFRPNEKWRDYTLMPTYTAGPIRGDRLMPLSPNLGV